MPTNSLDLDITKFDTGLAEAVKKVKSLESEVTDANKLLREMQSEFEMLAKTNRNLPSFKRETGKQDDLATDIKMQKIAVREGVAELKQAKGEQKRIEKEMAQSGKSESDEKQGGLLGKFNLTKTKVGVLGAAYAALAFVKTLVTTGRAASELTRELDALDRVPFKDTFDKNSKSSERFKGALLDVSGAISSIPLIGQVWDLFTAPLLQAAKFKRELIEVDKVIHMNAASSGEYIAKLNALEQSRAKLRKSDNSFGAFMQRTIQIKDGRLQFTSPEDERRAKKLAEIESERKKTATATLTAISMENRARNEIIAGSAKAAKLQQIELDRREEIARARQAVKEPAFGGTTAEGKSIVEATKQSANENAKVRISAANREYRITMDTLAVSSRTAEQKLHGAIGAQMAAGEELRLQERILKEREKETPEAIAQQKAKVAEAQASFDMAKRNVAFAQIENQQSKEVLSARLQGYRAESATAQANENAARARASQLAAGSTERKAAELAAESAAQDKTRAQLNEKIVGYQMKLNEAREKAGIGEEAERKELEAQLQFNSQRRAALVDDARQSHRNHDQELSDIDAESNALAKQYEVARRARSDEMYQIAAQTAAMEAQQKGLHGLAAEEQVRAKYTAQIVDQYRKGTPEGRANAANLEKQQAIELRRIHAQEHDETPEQRRRAKAANRIEARKARQQDARDAEMIARGQRNISSDLIDTAKRKHESYKEQQSRIAQAKSDNEDWPKHVREIYELLKKGS